MLNNDVLRSLRYMLDVSDAQLSEIIQLSGKQSPSTSSRPCSRRKTKTALSPAMTS
jgi:uncharacterized protein YehS (DUF1456 family)